MASGLPPRMMSVPRPAMLVAMVTAPLRPAWATISASRWWCLALSTWCGMPRLSSSRRSARSARWRPCPPGSAGRARSISRISRAGTVLLLAALCARSPRLVASRAISPSNSSPWSDRSTSHLLIRSISSTMAVYFSRSVRKITSGWLRRLEMAVGGDGDHVELVDLPELVGLGHGRAGHAADLVVELEEVLQGDGGQGLVLFLDPHPFLGLHGLVQAVAPIAAGHAPAGELVDDDHLVARCTM